MRLHLQQSPPCLFCSFNASLRLQQWRSYSRYPPRIRSHRTLRRSQNSLPRAGARGQAQNDDGYMAQHENRETQRWSPIRKIPTPVNSLIERAEVLRASLKESPMVEAYNLSDDEFNATFDDFLRGLHKVSYSAPNSPSRKVLQHLQTSYIEQGEAGLDAQLKFAFYSAIASTRFSKLDLRNQQAVADLRQPLEWYPQTRGYQRKIIMHVGPTNSGKTYHALKRLEEAEVGTYAGPLRLLAHEVYTRLNSKGQPCVLVTGEERRLPENGIVPGHKNIKIACTVEMMPSRPMDVAVIDEIQMIGNRDRGWAWTEAVLGSKARELHLCGEERAVPLIRELAALMGDPVEVIHYKRLSPLAVAPASLNGALSNLQKGDCVVSFSVMGIHGLRKQIEQMTGRKVAVVYGSLPPETRAAQARLFNDPSNDYDFLVASDAIGMGLNLSIKRIIFESVRRHDGRTIRTLSIPDIKQIGGRAGRYKTAFQAEQDDAFNQTAGGNTAAPNLSLFPPPSDRIDGQQLSLPETGLVTTLEEEDYPTVSHAMKADSPPLTAAGILPPASIVQRFCNYFPVGTPFSYVLLRLHEIARVGSRFFICDLKDLTSIADAIQDVKELSPEDRLIICQAPVVTRDPLIRNWIQILAHCIAKGTGGALLELEGIDFELLDEEVKGERAYLRSLEGLHKQLILYLWLSFRFSGVFTSRSLAMHAKELVEKNIEESLSKFNFSEAARKKKRQYEREQELLAALSRESVLKEQDVTAAESPEAHADAPRATSGEGGLSEGPLFDDLDEERDEKSRTEEKVQLVAAFDDDQITQPRFSRRYNESEIPKDEAKMGDDDQLESKEYFRSSDGTVQDSRANAMPLAVGGGSEVRTSNPQAKGHSPQESRSAPPFESSAAPAISCI